MVNTKKSNPENLNICIELHNCAFDYLEKRAHFDLYIAK